MGRDLGYRGPLGMSAASLPERRARPTSTPAIRRHAHRDGPGDPRAQAQEHRAGADDRDLEGGAADGCPRLARGDPARKVRTTNRGSGRGPRVPDLLRRHFAAARPDQLWVADFTYVPMTSGFVTPNSSSTPTRASSPAGSAPCPEKPPWWNERSGTQRPARRRQGHPAAWRHDSSFRCRQPDLRQACPAITIGQMVGAGHFIRFRSRSGECHDRTISDDHRCWEVSR